MKRSLKRCSIIGSRRFLIVLSLLLILPVAADAVELTRETVSDFITLYPGVYTEKEKDLVDAYLEEARDFETRGSVDAKALVNGTLPKETPGYVRSLKISETMVRYFSELRDPDNPLLLDAAYARKAGYSDIIAYPTLAAHDDTFMKAYPQQARDTLLVADLIHSVTNYRPVYPGDTLHWFIDSRTVKDLTPETGSIYRSNAIVNQGSVYNQRGEKVLEVAYTVEENIKIYKEGKAPENAGFSDMWEERGGGDAGRGGQSGPPGGGAPGEGASGGGRGPGGGGLSGTYYYTDADWEILKGLWAKEKHQGDTPLYWEDVKIGEQPTWTLEGPVESNPAVSVPWGMGLGGNQTLKKQIMDPETFKTLARSETDGIYRPADEDTYILPIPAEARTGMAFGEMGEMDAVLSGTPGGSMPQDGGAPGGTPPEVRAGGPEGDAPEDGGPGGGMGGGLMNFSRRDYAIRHFSDWMGDSGWLYNIRWGGLYSRDMAAQGDPAPAVNPDARHWLEEANVPGDVLAPSYILGQGNGGGKFVIVKSYVYDKYVLDGEFFVELGWWIETDAGNSFGEGAATVTLPSRKAKKDGHEQMAGKASR